MGPDRSEIVGTFRLQDIEQARSLRDEIKARGGDAFMSRYGSAVIVHVWGLHEDDKPNHWGLLMFPGWTECSSRLDAALADGIGALDQHVATPGATLRGGVHFAGELVLTVMKQRENTLYQACHECSRGYLRRQLAAHIKLRYGADL